MSKKTSKPLLLFDLETYLIEDGLVAPPMVCGTFALIENAQWEAGNIDRPMEDTKDEVRILLRDKALALVDQMLERSDLVWVAKNAPFDFSVILAHEPSWRERVFRLYDEGRVYDPEVMEKFIAIAEGKNHAYGPKGFSLDKIVKRRIGDDISASKTDPDAWRLRYAELDGVPVDSWPEAAIHYAEHDVIYMAGVMSSQRKSMADNFAFRPAEVIQGLPEEIKLQHQASWALRLCSTWGVRTDLEHTAKLKAQFEQERDALLAPAYEAGILRDDGTKNMEVFRERVTAAYQKKGGLWGDADIPLTAKGAVSTSREVLENSGDPVLLGLAKAGVYEKRLSAFIPVLERGLICPSYNVLVDSGRTSSYNPNIQQIPRDGGIREAFVARDGYCFIACDYDTLEMRSLAQILWEWYGSEEYVPTMVQTLREGKDLHLEFATELLGISYEEAERRRAEGDPEVNEARQFAKVGNFGFPGGLGAATFESYARGYGLEVTPEEAKRLYTLFRQKWVEMQWYFKDIGDLVNNGEIVQSLCRVRKDVPFTAAANSFFQGLAANGAKWALYLLALACYTDITSPLYGCRPIFFIHDEVILEAPIQPDMRPVCDAMEERLKTGMGRFITSVPVTCEAVPMSRWSKKAKRIEDDQGRVRIWTP